MRPFNSPKDTKMQGSSGQQNPPPSSYSNSLSKPRFLCPKCPKHFNRIENLTRHKANHDNAGKFPCPTCNRAFARSDLLNRHRKTHEPKADLPESLVTPTFPSGHSLPDSRYGVLVLQRANEAKKASTLTPTLPGQIMEHYQSSPANLVRLPSQAISASISHPPRNPQSHALAHLVHPTAAPQQFTPVENSNPTSWEGFMGLGDTSNSLMGSYDADISWTLTPFETASSSNHASDTDTWNGVPGYPSQRPPILVESTSIQSNIDAVDIEDNDNSDWPDKVSKDDMHCRKATRVLPPLRPISWDLVLEEARLSGLTPETIFPPRRIDDEKRKILLSTLNRYGAPYEPCREIDDFIFPPAEALDYFLRLYCRFIQPRFPILHTPTFDTQSAHPLLLLSMMFLGSSHSGCDRGRFSRMFHRNVKAACIRMHEMDSQFLRSVDNVFTEFLLCLAGTWSGDKEAYEFAEGVRGVVVTACRRMRLLDHRPSSKLDTSHFLSLGMCPLEATWRAWIEIEKKKRLGLSIYMFDCQYPTLFNNQSYVSKAESTTSVLPCDEAIWNAVTPALWKSLIGSAEVPAPDYYLRALNGILLHKYIKPTPPIVPTGEFGKLLLIYAIHTHIFDWRQATAMLNPTGLMGIEPPYDYGNSLREKRKWLSNALKSWEECYKDDQTSTAAELLHQLGHIALDVSISDMHLAAGRSNNMNDSNFADENLKHWANSEIANSTMQNVYHMLQLCHSCIQRGHGVDNSYEVSVCLFTGGIICWAYSKLKVDAPRKECMAQVRKASTGLSAIGSWKMCSVFGRILDRFQSQMGP